MSRREEVARRNKTPLDVAFLITELAPGGAEKALTRLALGLDRARFRPVVYSLSGRASDREKSLAPVLRESGIEVVELGAKSALDIPRAFRALRRNLRRRKPILLQSFMFHGNLLGRFAGRAAGVPIICSGIRVAERDSRFRLALDRWTKSLVDVWVCVGESVAKFTRETGKIPADRVVSIPNGAETIEVGGSIRALTAGGALESLEGERAKSAVPEGFGRRKRLIAVGRLAPQKGFDWLLENFPALFDESTRRDWELWIVGEGPERARLERIVRERGLEKDVWLAGWRPDVSDLLSESELFLLPSRWEGFPNALLEAAALGVAALCANVEGVEEILGGSEPQIAAPGDVGEWSRKIAALTGDPALRAELGKRNRARVASEFTNERVVERYARLWTQLIEEKLK
ncbi:MAG: glycosyltransferase [Thermoguttaceae bacterium]|nr:glycosyltransferase [Thermoguttaceae bacterium]